MEPLFPQFFGRWRRFLGLSTSKLCLWIFGLCRGWLQESSHQRWLLHQIKMKTLLLQALLRKQIKLRLSIKWVSIKWVFIVSTVRKLNKSVWASNCVCVCVWLCYLDLDCWCIVRVHICPSITQWCKCRASAVGSSTMAPCITHSGVMDQGRVCECKRGTSIEKVRTRLSVDVCVQFAWFSVCAHSCLCVNRAGGHHWQSLSPRMCLNTEGRC